MYVSVISIISRFLVITRITFPFTCLYYKKSTPTPTLEHRYIQASAYVADEKTIFPTAPVVQQQVATDQSSKVDDGAAVDEVYYNADGGIAALPKQQIAWPSALPVDDGSSKVDDSGPMYQNNTPWLPQVYADPNGGWHHCVLFCVLCVCVDCFCFVVVCLRDRVGILYPTTQWDSSKRDMKMSRPVHHLSYIARSSVHFVLFFCLGNSITKKIYIHLPFKVVVG